MAYGNIVGYEPAGDTPGAYRFRAADGTSLLSAGPAAEDLRAKLDAAAAAQASQQTASLSAADVAAASRPKLISQDQPVAGPDGIPRVRLDAPGAPPTWQKEANPQGLPVLPGALPKGDVAPPPPAGPPPPPSAAARPPGAPPAAAPSAPAPAGPAYTPVVVNGIATGDLQGPDGRVYRPHGASAGSPGGLVQKTEVRAGGHTASDEFMQQQQEAYEKRQAAAEVGMQAAQEQAAATRSFQQEQLRQNQADQAEAMRRQAQVQSGVQALQKKYDDAQAQYAKADKAGTGDNRGAGERFLDGLAAGLGAFGAAMTGTQNFAMQMISQKISNNIRAQEVGLATKKDRAQGALADLVRQTGSLDLARTAAKGIELRQAQIKFEQIASSTADEKVRANALDLSARLEQEHSATMEAYRQQAEGEVTKSFVNTPRVAGTSAGISPLTPGQSMELASKKASVEGTVAGTAGAIDKLGKGGGVEHPIESTKTEKVAALADGITAATELLKTLPAKEKGGDSRYDDPASGLYDRFANRDQYEKVQEQTQRLAKGAQATRGKSDNDADMAVKDVAGDGSVAARRRLAEQQLTIQRDNLVNELAGMTPDQQAAVLKTLPAGVREQLGQAKK